MHVAGELGPDSRHRLTRPFAYPRGALGIGGLQSGQPLAQPESVQLIDGEHANAARSASWLADQPFTATPLRVSQGGVHDLVQLPVMTGERARHLPSIVHAPNSGTAGDLLRFGIRQPPVPLPRDLPRWTRPVRRPVLPAHAASPPPQTSSAHARCPPIGAAAACHPTL